eukprot:gene2253-5256_t
MTALRVVRSGLVLGRARVSYGREVLVVLLVLVIVVGGAP